MIEPLSAPSDDLAFKRTRRRLRRDRYAASPELALGLVYLERNLFDPGLTLTRLYRACGLPPQRFLRLFYQVLGTTPIAYVARHRLATAAMLMQVTDAPIRRIGERVGYESRRDFVYEFQRWAGMTPRRFRARYARLAKQDPIREEPGNVPLHPG